VGLLTPEKNVCFGQRPRPLHAVTAAVAPERVLVSVGEWPLVVRQTDGALLPGEVAAWAWARGTRGRLRDDRFSRGLSFIKILCPKLKKKT
jgi:hypothetical protein